MDYVYNLRVNTSIIHNLYSIGNKLYVSTWDEHCEKHTNVVSSNLAHSHEYVEIFPKQEQEIITRVMWNKEQKHT